MTIEQRWQKKGCAFWVKHRAYSAPGKCENRRNVRPIAFRNEFHLACSPHRLMVESGRSLPLAEDQVVTGE